MDHDIAGKMAREGYVAPLELLPPAPASAVRAEFDLLEAREGAGRAAIGLVDRHFDERFIWNLAANPHLLDMVEQALGPSFYLLATHFFCKYPAAELTARPFVAWHQDLTYWGLDPPRAVTAWYAVDESTTRNGCMRVIPGSHLEQREHGVSGEPGNLLSADQQIVLTPEEEQSPVDIELRPGQISLHHGLLIHGSRPNETEQRRCGLTLRYVPVGVRQVRESSTGRPWRPVLVRGADPEDWPGAQPAPFDFPP